MLDTTNYDALSFDCYGTLIDWESGLGHELSQWASRHGLDQSVDALLAAFASHEHDVQADHPTMLYPDVLAETLRRTAAGFGQVVAVDEAAAFGASVPRWPAFPDSADALARLKERFKLIILSNVDRQSFAGSNARLGVEFDLIVTAQDVGAYKPSPRSFPALFDRLASVGVAKNRLLHVAQSLYHDHQPASVVGLPAVWIDRRAGRSGSGATPTLPPDTPLPRWRYTSMRAFVDDVLGER
jgi:2-haloacid dehalogenase